MLFAGFEIVVGGMDKDEGDGGGEGGGEGGEHGGGCIGCVL